LTQIPIVDAKTVERLLFAMGFEAVRRSHVFYKHADGRVTTLPHHQGRDLSRPLLREILRQIETTPEAFVDCLGRL
jgi:predicted RNA binding protein YcfA (HicA-like mRNA interferase family)